MNKIYKVMYSKVKQCAVVVSEIAKSHGHNGESSGVRKHAALTAAVLIALGSLSFTTAFVPMTAEAAITNTKTNGSNFVGVERPDVTFDNTDNDSKYENYNGAGAHGTNAITIGLKAVAADDTITIGDRNAEKSLGSVYIGRGTNMPTGTTRPNTTDDGYWATSVGYQSDATGYGSIAIGSNATANNSYDKDSTGHGIILRTPSGDGKSVVLNGKPDIQRASVAIGYGASADNGNIAIGSYSDASTDLRTAKTTDGQEIKSYLTDKKADSYVSVGKSDALRRISNVADGASASDVATVGQLQALAAKSGTYKAGFGIEITPDTTAKENTINLKRNLGNNSTSVTEVSNTGLILGGDFSGTYRPDEKYGNYGATGQYAVTLGGRSNRASGESSVAAGGMDNTADGNQAFVGGGSQNTASGRLSSAIGGAKNTASGLQSSAFGGSQNTASGQLSSAIGGDQNTASGQLSSAIGGDQNTASGSESSAIGGAKNIASGWKSSAFGGTDNISLDMLSSTLGGMNSVVLGYYATGIAGGSTGSNAWNALAAGSNSVVTVENGTAIGYQATTNERGTIAFGHDSGDVSGYTVTWQQRTDKDSSGNIVKNADGTTNDYTKDPTITENTYSSAYYNRLVKAADGIEDHDAVVMEQLKNASGVGSKIKVYQTDENGNIKFDKNNNPIEDTSAEAETKKTAAQKASEDAWGSAIGTGKVVDPNAKDKDSNGSGQLVTGGTVYNALQQQKTDLTDALTVKPGWGIEKTKNNTISVKHNLSTGDSAYAAAAYADSEAKGLILGGSTRDRIAGKKYGATTKTSVIVGARDALASNDNTVVIGGEENIASGESTTVVGGLSNTASGQGYSAAASVFGGSFNIANGLCSVVLGGIENVANNDYSTNSGGVRNVVFGSESINSGGLKNVVYANNASSFGGVAAAVNGEYSTGIAGGSTARNAQLSFAAGFQSVVTDSGVRKTIITGDEYERKWSEQTRELGPVQAAFNPITNKYEQYDKISTALGYQATADEPGTIAFGHDAGDESGYTYEWETLTDENGKPKENDIDNTTNDYTKPPKSVNKKDPYTSSYYNRLVKVADGIDDHDVVVMEQLKNASDVGNNIKVYKTDENGNVQFDENNKPIEDRSDAAKTKQKDSKDAWGKALGAGTFTTGTDTTPTNASTSYQLVTGKTLYDYDKPTGSQNYVNVNSTTGQNLSALDTQVKANTDALTKPNHNIKYYAVDETTLPKLTNFNGKDYSNEKNNGAVGMGSIAAGFNTHADGIASTVAGSYSGVINSKTGDLRGATALSYGTFNVNKNTDSTKAVSGVANSIIGQANVTTDSNAAIIYGAGNTVTNSYRDIDTSKVNLNKVKQDLKNKDVAAVIQDAQKAVPASGGQVMVMGGGNNVESAYMTQVVGVGNTVKGNQVNNDNGEWVTDTSDTAIKDYDEKKSSHYNYVDGFNNDVINGKHDYIIGANNTLTGDSYDDDSVKPIKKSNQSNIVIGDNHTLDRKKNTVIIGSSDTANTVTNGSDAVIIGHNANAASDTGADNAVAIGLSAKAAGGNAVSIGANTSAGDNSITIGSEASAVSGSNLAIGRYARVYGNKVTNAVALGQNAKALVTDGVAIGSGSQATVKGGSVEGYDPATGNDSEDTTATWKATKGAVSIGTADGKVTRQINGLAAGTNDTDAVNVAQLKKLNGMKANVVADNIGTKLNAGSTDEEKAAQQTNLNAWGTAIGTGTVAANNGQLVTGGTVFNETRISAKDDNGQTKTYKYLDVNASAGKNLEALDSALQTVNTTAGAHTALTIEGGTPAGTKDDQNKDVYAGKNILLHESKDENGKVTYDLKLAKDINIGTPGKDGEDGKIGIDGRDGHIGLNGSDGITVRGLDGENGAPGKDGVTITGPKGADGIDGKVGISGTDGKDAVSISGKDGVGHIGLTGPAGTNGKEGTNAVDITVKNGYNVEGKDGKDGINGENGVDGTSLTRIVYKDATGEHQIATMEDGLKFKGDDTTVIAKKLNNTMEIIGGADSKNLTEGNIGVNSTDKGQLKVQLAKDLTGITSISNQTTTKVDGKDVTTGAKITLGADGSVDVNGGKITHVGSGADASGNYTTTTNAANIGDVQKIVKDAVDSAADTTNKALAGKANVDASNIGANLKGEDGKAASAEAQKANAEKWGSAIGTGKIEKDNGQLVTGKTVYEYNKPVAEDGKTLNYVSEGKTTGQNLGALDAQVKNNADAIKKNSESIQNITNNVKNLSDNAVQYDKDSNKTKVTLGGDGGTTITNVMDGALSDNSTDAVNGKQLYNEQEARKAADNAITEKVTNNTNEITKIENGEGFTDAGTTVIKNLAKDAVQVKAGTAITVADNVDDKGNKTYTISANNNGTVTKDDGNLISGGTLYNEVHVTTDGSYIKGSQTVGQNLSSLDSGLKTTSDLIHTNTAGDTIQIGGNSTATKIDVNGKDGKGRVITGVVVRDANDPTSAANVGYVNGVTAANTQQIYRDMNNAYGRLNNNINKAAAGSNALAALHPLDYDPDDKADFAVGYGHYRNANAAAVGAFYHPNENTMVNVGVSLGNGDPGFNAGVSFKVGRGGAGHEAMSKTEMAKVINSQSKEIDALKKDNADKDKRIDALEQKMAEILAKLDKNGK